MNILAIKQEKQNEFQNKIRKENIEKIFNKKRLKF